MEMRTLERSFEYLDHWGDTKNVRKTKQQSQLSQSGQPRNKSTAREIERGKRVAGIVNYYQPICQDYNRV